MDIEKEVFEDAEDALPKEFEHMSADAINNRSRLLENEIRVLKDEVTRLNLDQNSYKEKVKENKEKIKLNNQLPYLVGNIVEVLDIKPEEEEEEDGATADLDSQRQGKCVVLKTSTRQTIFLPVVGLVDANALRPGVFSVGCRLQFGSSSRACRGIRSCTQLAPGCAGPALASCQLGSRAQCSSSSSWGRQAGSRQWRVALLPGPRADRSGPVCADALKADPHDSLLVLTVLLHAALPAPLSCTHTPSPHTHR
jgi:hypothetical protein